MVSVTLRYNGHMERSKPASLLSFATLLKGASVIGHNALSMYRKVCDLSQSRSSTSIFSFFPQSWGIAYIFSWSPFITMHAELGVTFTCRDASVPKVTEVE